MGIDGPGHGVNGDAEDVAGASGAELAIADVAEDQERIALSWGTVAAAAAGAVADDVARIEIESCLGAEPSRAARAP